MRREARNSLKKVGLLKATKEVFIPPPHVGRPVRRLQQQRRERGASARRAVQRRSTNSSAALAQPVTLLVSLKGDDTLAIDVRNWRTGCPRSLGMSWPGRDLERPAARPCHGRAGLSAERGPNWLPRGAGCPSNPRALLSSPAVFGRGSHPRAGPVPGLVCRKGLARGSARAAGCARAYQRARSTG